MNLKDANGKEVVACDFCGKLNDWVKQMVSAPRVAICDECVDLAAEIVKEARAKPAKVEG